MELDTAGAMSRRDFLAAGAVAAAAGSLGAADAAPSRQASGVKVGEVNLRRRKN